MWGCCKGPLEGLALRSIESELQAHRDLVAREAEAGLLWFQAFRFTNTILGVPYYKYIIMGPKTLFSFSVRGLHCGISLNECRRSLKGAFGLPPHTVGLDQTCVANSASGTTTIIILLSRLLQCYRLFPLGWVFLPSHGHNICRLDDLSNSAVGRSRLQNRKRMGCMIPWSMD